MRNEENNGNRGLGNNLYNDNDCNCKIDKEIHD